MSEKTRSQLWYADTSFDPELMPEKISSASNWFAKVREMRRDPTINLMRILFAAPALAAGWSVEADEGVPPDVIQDVEDQILPMRSHILRTGLFGCMDFGWQPFEKCWEVVDGKYVIKKLKPLLHDLTTILVVPKTGEFAGFRQERDEVDIKLPQTLLFNWDVEGTNWYGRGFMEIVESTYDKWLRTMKSADRYDSKVAGAHWVVHYPIGESIVDGVAKDNFVIAKEILNRLEANGRVAVPRRIIEFIDDVNQTTKEDHAWQIELISDKGGNTSFENRLAYFDKLKARAWGFPERAVLEGEHGTKAEAGEHGDFALTAVELRHDGILEQLNWHLVNQFLVLNHGEDYENTVRISALPLVDETKEFLKSIYEKLLANPEASIAMIDQLNFQAIHDKLDIPTGADSNDDDVEPEEPQGTTDDQVEAAIRILAEEL